MEVQSVRCTKTLRKSAYSSTSKPGVVVATFPSHDDKRKIMMSKHASRGSNQYKNVYINHDLSLHDRSGTFRNSQSNSHSSNNKQENRADTRDHNQSQRNTAGRGRQHGVNRKNHKNSYNRLDGQNIYPINKGPLSELFHNHLFDIIIFYWIEIINTVFSTSGKGRHKFRTFC